MSYHSDIARGDWELTHQALENQTVKKTMEVVSSNAVKAGVTAFTGSSTAGEVAGTLASGCNAVTEVATFAVVSTATTIAAVALAPFLILGALFDD